MTTFIVTAGEHSDYKICGAFSTREKAEAFARTFGDEQRMPMYPLPGQSPHLVPCARVEEYIIDSQTGDMTS